MLLDMPRSLSPGNLLSQTTAHCKQTARRPLPASRCSFRWGVIRILTRAVVRRVQYLANLRHVVANQPLDSHLQGNVGRAAALASAAHSYVDVVILHV